ncbi:MAG: DUF2304 family protein [Patescibacteria group bacterium]
MPLLQQAVALIIIICFLFRAAVQKKKNEISATEFRLWLAFWLLAALAVIFLKRIDQMLQALGFSLSGISFLFYLGVIALFYLVFRLRLSLAKLDRQLTEIARQIALQHKK